MPKITRPLTDTQIKGAKPKDKEYKLSDGKGLYLVVRKNGTKFFRFDYSFDNKRKSISFGIYPQTSLKEARDRREKYRELIKQKINPAIKKDKTTFMSVAMKWLEIMQNEWKECTFKKAKGVILNNTYIIANKEIKDITRVDILNIINAMQEKGLLETANRLLNYIERIFKYAVTYNLVEHNIVADIDKKNAVKRPRVEHLPALTKERDIKQLMRDIKSYGEVFKSDISTMYALQIAPYLFLRPYNLRHLTWDEVDLKNKLIMINGKKMKAGNDFVLPLCNEAIKIIQKIEPYSKQKSIYVFPSPTSNQKALSENTLNHALIKMGYKGIMTTHGFRAMFSTIAHENITKHGFSTEIIESCLAHTDTNKVRSAYNRDSKMKYFNEKKELLDWYCAYLNDIC